MPLPNGLFWRSRRMPSRLAPLLNLRDRDCNPAVARACHQSGIKLFGWDAHTLSQARRLVDHVGVDGLYCNSVSILTAVIAGRQRALE